MFTGIVEELGRITALEDRGETARLRVAGPRVTADAAPGDSIAVNGCCLTVVDCAGEVFGADLMAETLARTSLGRLAVGDRVNLERALRVQDRLGGHIVQGHVDATGCLLARRGAGDGELVTIGVPATLQRYLVAKGSVAVDGVSLTVVEVSDGAEPSFTVGLIPETLGRTTLGQTAVGQLVNLEVDVLAKYAERLLAAMAGNPPGWHTHPAAHPGGLS